MLPLTVFNSTLYTPSDIVPFQPTPYYTSAFSKHNSISIVVQHSIVALLLLNINEIHVYIFNTAISYSALSRLYTQNNFMTLLNHSDDAYYSHIVLILNALLSVGMLLASNQSINGN